MSPSFHFELHADIDEQSPARRRTSAFRRYRELVPHGRTDGPSGNIPPVALRRAEPRGTGERRVDFRPADAARA